jgi:DNA polymerase-3 subunit gamma/tau
MSYQVLARRLRPQRFADVVGQEHVTRTLQAAIRSGRVAHAFLFTGPRGVGKTTTARLLAKALSCEAGPAPEPCNACSICHEISEGSAFDVLEIDGASHTQVDRMRDLMETVAHRPLKARFKIYVIDEVHMLSQHSFNALLKTLEEPPDHAKFIFATTDPHKLLSTVVSRCQRYDLRRVGLATLTQHLARGLAAEGIALDPAVIALVAREAEGSVRDAQSLLEQLLAVGAETVDVETARALLGAADRRLVVAVATAMLAREPATVLRSLGALYEHGYDPQRFCKDLLEFVRHLAVLVTTGDRTILADLPEAEVDELVALSARCAADDTQRAFGLLLAADEALAVSGRAVEPQLVLEMALLRIATLEPLVPAADLVARLEALEAGGRAPSAPAAGRGGQPAGPRGSRSGGGPAARPATDAKDGAEAGWQAFLERVRSEKLALYLALAAGRLLAIDETSLRIGIESEAMRRDLSRRDVVERLGRVATEAFGHALAVEIVPMPTPEDTPRGRALQREQEAREDPLVRYAVEIFGGEVRGMRERRP